MEEHKTEKMEEKNPISSEKSDEASRNAAKAVKEEKPSSASEKGLTAVIRISGMVKVKPKVRETLDRLRLRRKYACVLLDTSKKQIKGMLNVVKHHVAYGVIDKDVLAKLLKHRGESVEGRKKKLEIDFDRVAGELINGKKLQDLKLKPFFRLHPPKKGIKSKLLYPKGVLGDNKQDINKLISRML